MTKIYDISLTKEQMTNFSTVKESTVHLKFLGKKLSNYNEGKACKIELKHLTVSFINTFIFLHVQSLTSKKNVLINIWLSNKIEAINLVNTNKEEHRD